ncbi:hypothetical protein K32_05040 [Kaistia sp. 32K]|uniref:glucosamine inositolphosphorylceramide transferase family protein n=1 Tax=Kaistia sp. 32K TaxID=2795690 RepID=UPI0019156EBE|nr:formyl transferase [Kaistia sp. 32K]BCP51887.1 hypothetical protein K32_05040 [Kaistia sp. 32K]
MRIDIRLDPTDLRGWQREIVARLSTLPGCAVRVEQGRAAAPLPKGAATLFLLERTLYGAAHDALEGGIAWSDLGVPDADDTVPDLLIDLCGDGSSTAPVLTLRCDGGSVEAGALAAVLDERAPVFETILVTEAGERILSAWRPAAESPRSATAALGMLLGRAAHMVVHQAARLAEGIPPGSLAPAQPPAAPRRSAAGFFAAMLAARVKGKIERQLGRAPNWYVAWRERPDLSDALPVIGPSGFHRLADDGARFYADPFLWEQDGRRFLFVEEFPYATGKGVISVAEIDAAGKFETPRVVLETDCHLSYPFLFEHDGAIWMIPETSSRRTVELYRADPFPEQWTLHSVLLENVDLGDATLLKIGDSWWMFAASRERWTSSWDALSLYHAPSPFGPWQPHPGNPVLVDLHAARPAGRILDIGGRLVRPVQNCDGLYGAALGFAEIRSLTPEGYAQTLSATALPWGDNLGLHTFNRSPSLEVIDLFGPRG